MMSNDIKSFILENDKESTSNQNSVKKKYYLFKDLKSLCYLSSKRSFLKCYSSWLIIVLDVMFLL